MKGQLHRTEVRAAQGDANDRAAAKGHRRSIGSEFKRMAKRALRRLGRLIVRER